MTYSLDDLWLLGALARLLGKVDPVPAEVLASAEAAGLHVGHRREPRLADRCLDAAWLLPA
jgi:hypothetical protein